MDVRDYDSCEEEVSRVGFAARPSEAVDEADDAHDTGSEFI